jgi:hypothetical protein
MRLSRWPAAVALSVVLLSVTCVYTTGWQEWKRHSTIREEDDFVRTMLSHSIMALVAAALLAAVCAMRPDVPVGSASSHTPRSTATKDQLTRGGRPNQLRREFAVQRRPSKAPDAYAHAKGLASGSRRVTRPGSAT